MHSFRFDTLFTRMFLLVVGAIVALPAGYKLYTYGYYLISGVAVVGVIEHPAASRDLGGRPLIRYTDATGHSHEFKSRAKTHWFRTPQKGEKIPVLILPDAPDKPIVDNVFHYLILPLIFLLAGGYCCYQAWSRDNSLFLSHKP